MRQCLVALFVLVLLMSCSTPMPSQQATGEQCNYPRLHARFSNADPAITADPARVDRLRPFDSIELDVDANTWDIMPTLRSNYPGVMLWAYMPAQFYWDDWSGNCQDHATRCLLVEMSSDAWAARDAKGEIIYDSYKEPKVDPTGGYYAAAQFVLADALAGFDGVRWDVANGRVRLPGLDLDGDGVADLEQHGQNWIDLQYRDGLAPVLTGLRYQHVGNASWEPNLVTGHPQFYGLMNGFLVEYYTYHNGSQYVRPGLAWWADYYLSHPDAVWMFMGDVQDEDHFGALRRSLALALQGDGFLVLESPIWPGWCDECGVRNGITSKATTAGDWLGCPLGESVEILPGVWRRDYEHGAAVLNTTDRAERLDGSGLRSVSGWYQQEVNNGQWWSGVVPANDGRILWRPQQAPTPTATATQQPPATATATATASPQPTPADTPTPNLQATVEAVIDYLDGIKDAWNR